MAKYFEQEHFSLRRLIRRLDDSRQATETRLAVVYTRSDASIHRIPGEIRRGRSVTCDPAQLEVIRALVCENAEIVAVEHLYLLRSESMLRSSITSWLKHNTRRVYVLVIDMAVTEAVDRTNFVRTFVEQNLNSANEKTFILLLHYPPSTSMRASCYPALFLGGWSHHFLDGIGHGGDDSLGEDRFFDIACRRRQEYDHCDIAYTGECLKSLLPRVLSHVATQDVLYSGQLGDRGSQLGSVPVDFTAKQKFLTSLMRKKIGDETMAEIICLKFSVIWLSDGLVKTIEGASEALLHGTTQLSMSMSVHATLTETFDAYVAYVIVESNQLCNLDVLRIDTTKEVLGLFGLILKGLPVPPLDELVMQRGRNSPLLAMPSPMQSESTVNFPFFAFINFCIREVVELAQKEVSASARLDEKELCRTARITRVHDCAMKFLSEKPSAKDHLSQRRKVTLAAVQYVQNNAPLLRIAYMRCLLELRTGCQSRQWLLVIEDWLSAQLEHENVPADLVGVHVYCSVNEAELLDLASWSMLSNQFISEFSPTDVCSRKIAFAHQVLSSKHSLFSRLLSYFEQSVMSDSLPRREWSGMFDLFVQQSGALLGSGTELKSVDIACRLRVLCFLQGLIRKNAPHEVEKRVLDLLYDKEEHRVSTVAMDHVSISSLDEILGTNPGFDNLVLFVDSFLSPPWTNLVRLYLEEDLKYVLDSAAGRLFSEQAALSSLAALKGVVLCPYEVTEGLGSPLCGITSGTLKLLSERVVANSTISFVEGNRATMLHFVPKWLRRGNNAVNLGLEPGDAITVFFQQYSHSYCDGWSNVLFDFILRSLVRQTDQLDSEGILLSFLAEIEREAELKQADAMRLARLRTTGDQLVSFVNTHASAMMADARLVCLVAKVAQELAYTDHSIGLSGTYGEFADRIFSNLFALDGYQWAEFFFGIILYLQGPGTLAEILGSGCLRGRLWCQKWIEGIPTAIRDSKNALADAERALAEAEREEQRKTRELRLCPHCRSPFMVDRLNCGTFYCGRDAHGIQGNPAVGGVQVGGVYGCNRAFTHDRSLPYSPDSEILDPLRKRLDELNLRLQQHEDGASLWERAASFQLPILDVRADRTSRAGSPIAPFSAVFSERAPESTTKAVLELLSMGVTYGNQFRILPEMVQVRTSMYIFMNKQPYLLTGCFSSTTIALHLVAQKSGLSFIKGTGAFDENERHHDGRTAPSPI